MRQRCYNTSNPNYKNYGGKGVSVCNEWMSSYKSFEQWSFKNGYEDGLTIDRVDSNRNYCPENCRWISLSENSAGGNYSRHKNKTKLTDVYAILPDGSKVTIDNISRFAAEHNLSYSTVSAILHGRMPAVHHGYIFHSNLSRKV